MLASLDRDQERGSSALFLYFFPPPTTSASIVTPELSATSVLAAPADRAPPVVRPDRKCLLSLGDTQQP